MAPSPGQLAAQQAADGSFTLGPCTSATLLNSTYLRMEGVPASVSWLQLAPTHTAGVLPTVRPALFKFLYGSGLRVGSGACLAAQLSLWECQFGVCMEVQYLQYWQA